MWTSDDDLRRKIQPAVDELNQGGGIVVERKSLRKFLVEMAQESNAARRKLVEAPYPDVMHGARDFRSQF
jgi:hypothetical protein